LIKRLVIAKAMLVIDPLDGRTLEAERSEIIRRSGWQTDEQKKPSAPQCIHGNR
jgi:hypothetical protein